MALIELPHSAGCLVCGKDNPHGLHLANFVDEDTGTVRATFIPQPHHIGFQDIVHGGILSTVVDEVMVWSATWKGKRFCVCGELTLRFRHGVTVGQELTVESVVEFYRPKLVETAAKIYDTGGRLIAAGGGKYVPMPLDQHQKMLSTLVASPSTQAALGHLLNARF